MQKMLEFDNNNWLTPSHILEVLFNISGGYKNPNDSFFDELNKKSPKYEKLGVLTLDDENEHHLKNSVTCNVFGCNLEFDTLFAFESHYNALHRYLCSTCKKNLPNAHLLDLHICENHDSFFKIQAERKPMYSCYLEECQHKTFNCEERKEHCVKVHKFPANFRFDQCSNKKLKAEALKADKLNLMDNTTDALSKKLDDSVPKNKTKNFSFGHQKCKVFNSYSEAISKEKHTDSATTKTSVLENKSLVSDLKDSLPI